MGCHFLLQGIFPTQGLNPSLPYCRQILYHLSHQGSQGQKINGGGGTPSLPASRPTSTLPWREGQKPQRHCSICQREGRERPWQAEHKDRWVWGGGAQTAGTLCPGKEGRAQPPPPPDPARGPLCQWAVWCACASSRPWARPVLTGGGRTAGGGPVPEGGLSVTGMTSGCEPGLPGKPGQAPRSCSSFEPGRSSGKVQAHPVSRVASV